MMVLPLILAAAPRQNADQLIDKLADRLKAGFSVDFTLKHSAIPSEIKGHYEFSPPQSGYYHVTGAGSDFAFIVNKQGAIEIENNSKMFYEIGPMGALYLTESHLSGLSTRAFPYLIGRAQPRTAYQDFRKFRFVKEETMDGLTVQHIASGEGQTMMDIWLTSDGRIVRYQVKMNEDFQPATLDFRFGKFGKANPSRFNISPPAGYHPLALPRNPHPPLPTEQITLDGWLDLSGKKVKLPIKENTLLVVTRGDCGATSRSREMVTSIAGKYPIIVLSDTGAPKGFERYPLYRDSGHNLTDRFFLQGTPFFMAVDSKGTVIKTWLGYGAADAASLKKEILAALGQ